MPAATLVTYRTLTFLDTGSGEPRPNQPPTDLVPVDWTVTSASIQDGHAYLMLHQAGDGGATRLDVLDLRSGRLVGSYPVPGLPTDRADTEDYLQVEPGVVVMTVSAVDRNATVAIRVPN